MGVGYGQGGLACCSSWGCQESDTTEWQNCTELNGKESVKGIQIIYFGNIINVSVQNLVVKANYSKCTIW